MTTMSMAVTPTIRLGPGDGTPLGDAAASYLLRAVVDTNLQLPGMFELTFLDDGSGVLATAGVVIGTTVQVFGLAPGETTATCLIKGEITGLEGRFEALHRRIVVRGYDGTHRLQRVRRTRTFLNMTDSDIASRILREAGITDVAVDQSTTTHDHIGQCDQTDWEFLGQRAAEIGYELVMDAGVLHFRAASGVSSGTSVPLLFPIVLRSFRPRVTAGNLSPEVEVRVWDPLQSKVLTHVVPASTGAAALSGQQPGALGTTFTGGAGPVAPAAQGSATGDLGPAPSTSAHVVHDRPVAVGTGIDPAGQQAAKAIAEHMASTFAEAEGEATGTPHIRAGAAVDVSGVPDPFGGSWLVTGAQHVFDTQDGGYTTRFVASGRQIRSLLGLASGGGATRPDRATLNGVYCGVVTNNNDPNKLGRVKVALPWLSPDYESDWACAVQFASGKASGAMFLPEVGDEVLVAFEFADPRRPYVLGGIVNNATAYSLGGDAIKATGMAGEVVRRGFVSSAGNRLMFHDEVPPGGGSPTASDLVLGTGDGSLALAIDQTAGTVTLSCKPAAPGSSAASGQISIQCGDAGIVNIATGAGGSVAIDGGDSLSLKAKTSIQIESNGQVAIKGTRITLN